jgi:hypothetical protein
VNPWGDVQSWLSVLRYTTPWYKARTLEMLDANAPKIAMQVRKELDRGNREGRSDPTKDQRAEDGDFAGG